MIDKLKKQWDRLKSIKSRKDLFIVIEEIEDLFKRLFSSVEIKSGWVNLLIAVPRVTFGVFLLFDVWRIKIGMPVNELATLMPDQFVMPDWLSWIDKTMLNRLERIEYWVEGGMMITGFNTRLIALSLVWTAADGLFTSTTLGVWSVPLMPLFIVVCTYSVILGSGKIGIDYIIAKWFSKKKRQNNKNRTKGQSQ
ncbi:MAG TPA: hypothetical protein VJ915_03785 [Balneolaceae bacterium]|nr:hypothetical protein [Balneolaceae bacterium]